MSIVLEWKNLPKGWTISNSYGSGDRQEFRDTIERFQHGTYLGGDFRLRLHTGSYQLAIRRIGYLPVTRTVTMKDEDGELAVEMNPVAQRLAPVRVGAGPNAGGYGVYLRDPNGILIELFQPPRRANP